MAPEKVQKLQRWLQQPEVSLLYSVLEARGLANISEILESTTDEEIRSHRDEYQQNLKLIELLETIAKGEDQNEQPFSYNQPPYAIQAEQEDGADQTAAADAARAATFRPSTRGRVKIPRPPRRPKG